MSNASRMERLDGLRFSTWTTRWCVTPIRIATCLLKVEGADTQFIVDDAIYPLADESAVLVNGWQPHSCYVHVPRRMMPTRMRGLARGAPS